MTAEYTARGRATSPARPGTRSPATPATCTAATARGDGPSRRPTGSAGRAPRSARPAIESGSGDEPGPHRWAPGCRTPATRRRSHRCQRQERSGRPASRLGPSEIGDAATAVGRKREEVGEDGLLEAKDRRCLLDAGQSALTAGLGGRIAPDHQQRPALSRPASLRERPRTHTWNYTIVISSN